MHICPRCGCFKRGRRAKNVRIVEMAADDVGVFNRAAEVTREDGDRPIDDATHRRIDHGVAPIRAVGDTKASDAALQAAQLIDVGRDTVAVPIVRAGDDRQHQGAVPDRARHRADVLERLPARDARVARIAAPGIERHAAERRLEAVQATEAAWRPNRAAAVAPDSERHHALATAAAEPALEPPVVMAVFQGLRVSPKTGSLPRPA